MSAARRTFSQRATGLRKSFRFVKVRPRSIPKDIRTLTFQAAVFHLSAAFEDYLLQVLTSWMYELQRQKKTTAHVPTRLRNLLFLKSNEGTLRNLVVTGSEREALDKMESAKSGLEWFDPTAVVPSYGFYSGSINDKKFPSPDNIEALIGRFGYRNALAEMSRRTASDVPLKMKSFIDVRNALAHEAPPDLTEDDLEDYFSSVATWVVTLDKILFKHVIKVSGRDCWQR